MTLGLFDVVSVRRPVGRRKDTTALVGIVDAGECYLALPTCRYRVPPNEASLCQEAFLGRAEADRWRWA